MSEDHISIFIHDLLKSDKALEQALRLSLERVSPQTVAICVAENAPPETLRAIKRTLRGYNLTTEEWTEVDE